MRYTFHISIGHERFEGGPELWRVLGFIRLYCAYKGPEVRQARGLLCPLSGNGYT